MLAFSGSSSDALKKGLTFSDNFAAFAKTLTIRTQDDWIAPTLINGFASFGSTWELPGYRKQGREVVLRGLVKGGATASTVLVLPAAYAPPAGVHLATIADNQAATLQVHADGSVRLSAAVSYASHLSIRARWEASDPSPVPNPVFPVSFASELAGGARPAHVLITAAQDVTGSSAVPVSLGQPAWTASADKVSILDIGGAQPNRTYSVTVLVIGG